MYVWKLISYLGGILIKLIGFPFYLVNTLLRSHRKPRDKILTTQACRDIPVTKTPTERPTTTSNEEFEIVEYPQAELFPNGELQQRLESAKWERERFEYFKAWEMGMGGELIAFDYVFEPVKTVLLKVWCNGEYQKDKQGQHKIYKAVVKQKPGKQTVTNPTGKPIEYFKIKGVEFEL